MVRQVFGAVVGDETEEVLFQFTCVGCVVDEISEFVVASRQFHVLGVLCDTGPYCCQSEGVACGLAFRIGGRGADLVVQQVGGAIGEHTARETRVAGCLNFVGGPSGDGLHAEHFSFLGVAFVALGDDGQHVVLVLIEGAVLQFWRARDEVDGEHRRVF